MAEKWKAGEIFSTGGRTLVFTLLAPVAVVVGMALMYPLGVISGGYLPRRLWGYFSEKNSPSPNIFWEILKLTSGLGYTLSMFLPPWTGNMSIGYGGHRSGRIVRSTGSHLAELVRCITSIILAAVLLPFSILSVGFFPTAIARSERFPSVIRVAGAVAFFLSCITLVGLPAAGYDWYQNHKAAQKIRAFEAALSADERADYDLLNAEQKIKYRTFDADDRINYHRLTPEQRTRYLEIEEGIQRVNFIANLELAAQGLHRLEPPPPIYVEVKQSPRPPEYDDAIEAPVEDEVDKPPSYSEEYPPPEYKNDLDPGENVDPDKKEDEDKGNPDEEPPSHSRSSK